MYAMPVYNPYLTEFLKTDTFGFVSIVFGSSVFSMVIKVLFVQMYWIICKTNSIFYNKYHKKIKTGILQKSYNRWRRFSLMQVCSIIRLPNGHNVQLAMILSLPEYSVCLTAILSVDATIPALIAPKCLTYCSTQSNGMPLWH